MMCFDEIGLGHGHWIHKATHPKGWVRAVAFWRWATAPDGGPTLAAIDAAREAERNLQRLVRALKALEATCPLCHYNVGDGEGWAMVEAHLCPNHAHSAEEMGFRRIEQYPVPHVLPFEEAKALVAGLGAVGRKRMGAYMFVVYELLNNDRVLLPLEEDREAMRQYEGFELAVVLPARE